MERFRTGGADEKRPVSESRDIGLQTELKVDAKIEHYIMSKGVGVGDVNWVRGGWAWFIKWSFRAVLEVTGLKMIVAESGCLFLHEQNL